MASEERSLHPGADLLIISRKMQCCFGVRGVSLETQVSLMRVCRHERLLDVWLSFRLTATLKMHVCPDVSFLIVFDLKSLLHEFHPSKKLQNLKVETLLFNSQVTLY